MPQPDSLESLDHLARLLISDLRNAIASISKKVAEDEDAYAIQSWLIYLTMLAYDAARGAADLLIKGNTRAAVILQRQLYEYAVRATYFVGEPEDGIKAFRARRSLHYDKLQNLSLRQELRQAIDDLHSEWKASNPQVTDDYGRRKFHKMALAVDDSTGYAYYYEIPSILVHATLVGFDVFAGNQGRLRVSTKSVSLNAQIGLASVILILLRYLRRLHTLGFADDPSQYDSESVRVSELLASELGVRPGEWSNVSNRAEPQK